MAQFFCIKYIGYQNKIPVIIGRKYINLRSVSMYLCNSQDMKIHISKELDNIEVKAVTEIKEKAFRMVINNQHYMMSLLHF